MALSADDAATIGNYLKNHAGASTGTSDTVTVATWLRSHWGGSGTDAAVIALYGQARADTDLMRWANDIRLHGDGST